MATSDEPQYEVLWNGKPQWEPLSLESLRHFLAGRYIDVEAVLDVIDQGQEVPGKFGWFRRRQSRES